MISLKINCACGQHYTCEVQPQAEQTLSVACPICQRDGSAAVNQFLASIRHRQIPVKILCACGQKYSFQVQPREGRMPAPIACPVCQRDGTAEANRIIASLLAADPRTLPPPGVSAVLNAVQTPMLERLRAYEQRIHELEKDLADQSKENRELLKLKIDLLREKIESERSVSRLPFN